MKGVIAGADNLQGLAASEFASIRVTKRTDRSLLMFALQHVTKPFRGWLITPTTTYPAGSPRLTVDKKAARRIAATERRVEDIYVYDVRPRGAAAEEEEGEAERKRARRLYYFAGGGWQMPPSGEHWALVAELATGLADTTAVSLVSYPLAPHSAAPVAFPMLTRLYRALMAEAAAAGETVILAGDSSGGNLVLSLLVTTLLEDERTAVERPCPAAVMVVSPSTDLRRQNADIVSLAKKDPILKPAFINSTAKNWRGDWSPCDIRVSPLYADLMPIARRGVKVHGVCGRYDILSPDAVLFREKCNLASIEGEWLDWEKQMHCFPLAFSFKLRESVEGKDWMLDVLRRT